jgi:ribA/ribD-fused uncharacterized protein
VWADVSASDILLPGTPIDHFAGEFAFLSNFYPAEVEYEGKTYPTVEHAFQAAKTVDPEQRAWIRFADYPGLAKKRGRSITLREGWDEMRVRVMSELVLAKFVAHPDLRAKLLATGERPLVEGNHWGDRFWGVCDGQGENWLGRILVRVRDHLK